MGFEPEITDDLDEPYSQRVTPALPPYSSPSIIGIDGRPYLLDTKSGDYKRVGVDVVQQRNTSDNRDILLLPQGIWRQSITSWHQGAGQSNIDRDNALPYRFFRSYGVDPWDWWQLSLLPTTEDLGVESTVDPMFVVTNGGKLVVAQTDKLTWFDSLADTGTALTVNAGETIIDVVSDGYDVVTLHDDGKVYKSTNETTTALYQTNAGATFIGYDKDYLICGVANVLKNITAAAVTLFTHPQTSFRWVDSCAGNSCIYVLGGISDKWVIHRVGIKPDGTGLSTAIVAGSLPDGEIGYSIGSYLGFIFIGTNKGVRMAIADGNGDLTLGALIPTDAPVLCFEGQDKYVWYGNSSMDGSYATLASPDFGDLFPGSPAVGLGRMDLSTFTVTELTPAYANDLVAVGLVTGATRSVVTFEGKRVFSVDNGGVFVESDDLMPAGWVEQGVISFSVEDSKTALYMQSKWEPLEGSIAIDMSFDSQGYARFGNYSSQGSIKSENTPLNGAVFSRAQPRIVLVRDDDDATLGPTVTRWELRARPVKGKASRWVLPIINHETLDLDGQVVNRDPLIEYNRLMDLVEGGGVFLYQESLRAHEVVAVDFEWKPEKVTESGKAWQGVYTLVIEEVL